MLSVRSYFGVVAIGGLVPILLASCGTPPAPKTADPNAKPVGSQQPTAAAPEARFVEVDNAKVSSLQSVTLRDDSRQVVAEVPQVPKARNLTQAVEVVREKQLRLAHWAKADQVEIRAKVIASSPDAVGVVLKSVSTEDGQQIERPATLWYDPSTAQTFSSPILIEETKWADFARAVTEAGGQQKLDPAKVSAALADAPAPQGTGPAMGFDPDGNVVLKFGSGVLDAKPQGLVLPKDRVAGLLSAYGMNAQAAATRPADYTATATPKATPEKNPSAAPGSATPGSAGTATPGATPAGSATPRATATPGGSATPALGERPSTAVGPDCRVLKCVALTYDDGPAAGTPKVVQALDDAKAAATFFQMGQSIKAYPDNVRLVASSGYEVGNHSANHPDLAKLSGTKLREETLGNSDRLEAITGRKPLLFRPPYGSHKDATDKVIAEGGMAIINWNVDTMDWQTKSTAKTENSAIYQGLAKPSSIVLMHDIHDSTVAAAPTIVKDLQDKGATLVTVSELTVNSGGVYAGHGYCTGTNVPQTGYGCKG
ncbi:polysaccharide deacetylase family protein [Enemella evansiae]|uniref:polysaccharide deacetylase family protein n=1 Tax=Enemella evansiae TaxID=2016499 RepID=UPI00117F58D2|nr:polysaccharide deacetylase family protein [Enemella evansiae]